MLKNRPLTAPLPEGCSDNYAAGWRYADWWLSTGGSPDADSPDGWHAEKYEGWWDRLARAKQPEAIPASA